MYIISFFLLKLNLFEEKDLFKIFICTFYFLDEVFRVHQTVNIFMCSMLVPGLTPLLRVPTLPLCSLPHVLLQDPVEAAPLMKQTLYSPTAPNLATCSADVLYSRESIGLWCRSLRCIKGLSPVPKSTLKGTSLYLQCLLLLGRFSRVRLCDPIDGGPPGSPVPGNLQARTLGWVATSFSRAWKWKVKVRSLSRVRPSAAPWTAAQQAPPSLGFSRREHWSGCRCLLHSDA